MRSKTGNGNTNQYFYENGKLIREINGDIETKYLYGKEGLIGFIYNGATYLYQKSIFGDIEKIIDSTGQVVAEYSYTAFGECSIITEINGIANLNKFRYRGYYFISDMGLYYLKTRFYNPITGRFISPDDTKYLQPDVINGLNLFAYCGNNPVMNIDPNGNSFLASLLIGAAIGFLTSYVPDVVSEMQDGFDWSDFNTFGDNWQKYLGSTLGGAIGGIGSGLGLSILTNGIGNVVEGLFTGSISSFGDAFSYFVSGGVLGGIGYGISAGITKIFADKKIFTLLGGTIDSGNTCLVRSGFVFSKGAKQPLNKIYNELYNAYGYNNMEKIISNMYSFITGWIF